MTLQKATEGCLEPKFQPSLSDVTLGIHTRWLYNGGGAPPPPGGGGGWGWAGAPQQGGG
jgi:hypothetical protein